jgi:hypothetical protein
MYLTASERPRTRAVTEPCLTQSQQITDESRAEQSREKREEEITLMLSRLSRRAGGTHTHPPNPPSTQWKKKPSKSPGWYTYIRIYAGSQPSEREREGNHP